MTAPAAQCIGCACTDDRAMTGELLPRAREPERLLLPGDIEFDSPFFPFPELDDYDVALDLLP